MNINYKFTKEEYNWFLERLDTSHTGRTLVSAQLVKKFKKLSEDEYSDNVEIRNYIISYFSNVI